MSRRFVTGQRGGRLKGWHARPNWPPSNSKQRRHHFQRRLKSSPSTPAEAEKEAVVLDIELEGDGARLGDLDHATKIIFGEEVGEAGADQNVGGVVLLAFDPRPAGGNRQTDQAEPDGAGNCLQVVEVVADQMGSDEARYGMTEGKLCGFMQASF